MTINKIEVWSFQPRFRDGPYAMSHIIQEWIDQRIYCVHTDEGIAGLGELVYAPLLSESDRLARTLDEPDFLAKLIGQKPESILDFTREIHSTESWQGIAFALETAYFDILRKQNNCSFAEVLGGVLCECINNYFSISENSLEGIHRRMEIAGPDRKVIQLKVGVGSLEEDEAKIRTTLDLMNDGQIVLADANGGWSLEAALNMVDRIHHPGLVWEEPCKPYEDNITVARATETPVMLDGQSSTTAATARKAIIDNVAASICIKPALIGGLVAAREIRDLCVQAGVKMRIDGPWCGDIASAAIVDLALGVPEELLISGCDLREPLTLGPDLNGIVTLTQNLITTSTAGFDVEAFRKMLGEPEACYQ